MGKQWKQWQTLFWETPKSLQMVIAAMKLKDACSLEEKLWPTSFSQPVQSLSRVQLFATPWIAARQASLSITNSQSLLRLMSIKSVMPSSHLILCRPLLLLPPIPPSIRVFSNSVLKGTDITLPTEVHLVKAMVFRVVVYGCESWTVKKAECRRIDTFELQCWRRFTFFFSHLLVGG